LPMTIDHRPTTNDRKGYNSAVNAPAPFKPVVDHEPQDHEPQDHEDRDNQHQHRHSIYAAEATGLLLMAVLLLVLTLIRYWRDIPWGAR
jgi:hypothetical protein